MPFPINPSVGDTYVENNTTYEYLGPVNGWYRKEVDTNNDTTYIGSDGAPGGVSNDTEVIFNDNGSLASDSGLTYNKTSDTLTSGKYTASLGTAAAPSIYFDANTGIYSPGADQVAISTNGTEKLRITSDAYIRLASGTGGIQFNGDTAAANALDDYEEGTYTPAAAGFGSLTGGTFSTANYIKIGRLVIIHKIAGSSLTYNTGSGSFCFITLPFVPASGTGPAVGFVVTSTVWKVPVAFNSGGSIGLSIKDEAGNYLSGLSSGKPTELQMSIAYYV